MDEHVQEGWGYGKIDDVADEPLRMTFRRQVREEALRAAQRLTVTNGWSQVHMAEVAAQTGVSRQTLYNEFRDKQGLGEALILRETDRFITGVSRILDEHGSDVATGVTAAVEFTLAEADASPLLRAILTSARDGADELLPLLTTRSAPVLQAATSALVAWFDQHLPDLDPRDLADAADTVVRLAVSHLVLPTADRTTTARRLARITLLCLRLEPDIPVQGSELVTGSRMEPNDR